MGLATTLWDSRGLERHGQTLGEGTVWGQKGEEMRRNSMLSRFPTVLQGFLQLCGKEGRRV